jgi:DNA-binding CsgD family transcriptional regulator
VISGASAVKTAPWIVICGIRSSAWSYQLRYGTQILGRLEDCEIQINHATVSRRHAEIIFDGMSLKIADLRSANGTYLNGNRVAHAIIKLGDTIRVGNITFEVLASDAAPTEWDEETKQPINESPDSVEAICKLLSPSDSKVLKLMLQGLAEKAIAARLELSEQTVHWRINKRIYKSLGVHSRSELLALLLG